MDYLVPTPHHHGSCTPDSVGCKGAAVAYLHAATPGSRIAGLVTGMPIKHRCRQPGEYLFRAGDAFHFFHVLHAGFAKTCHLSADGRERTTGFHMRGDILGLDAVASGTYSCDGVALDACEVLAIPYDAVVEYCQRSPDLVRELHCAFSAEIRGDRDQMLKLGSLLAEGRVAAFLLEMSARFGARGFSPTQLQLRLTRQEIGSMLALKLETVSRVFSQFARQGLISVNLREIVLLDREGLLDIISRPGGRDRKRRRPARANPAPGFPGVPARAA
ncbi:MAG: Crp/Fnr family transcriptional regulator [Betaproteobacteria bacterium]